MEKKFFEKLIKASLCLFLTAILLTGAGYTGMFGGIYAESDVEGESTTPIAFYYQGLSDSTGSKSDGCSALNMTPGQRYVLEVYTGLLPGNSSKYIIIRYYASPGDKLKGILSTQYLAPGDSMCDQWDNELTNSDVRAAIMNDSGWDGFNSSNEKQQLFFKSFAWQLDGNKTANYRLFSNMLEDTSYDAGNYDSLGGSWYYKDAARGYYHDYDKYTEHAKNLMSASNVTSTDAGTFIGGHPTVRNKVFNPELFESDSTEYIIFRSEYGIYELASIDFYCETDLDNEVWLIKGWALYETNWNNNFRYGINNYAFVSDRMAFDIDYDRCLGKSLPDNLSDGFSMVKSGYYRFVKDTQANRDAKNPSGGKLNKYFFTTNAGTLKQSPVTYTFEINLMDRYGAGIDTFNKTPAPGSKLELSEAMTAKISYKNADGYDQELTLPVISNAVFEYAFPTAEDAASGSVRYKNITENKMLSYAQQGDSIVFSVVFPSKSEITGIDLRYENPQDYEDYILVKDIRVYGNSTSRYVDRDRYTDPSEKEMDIEPLGNLLYESDQSSGGYILENSTKAGTFEMHPAGEGKKIPESDIGKYLISFRTSTVNFTDTQADDIYVRFEYLSDLGGEMVSQTYNLKELCQDFCGYNPAYNTVTGEVEDGSYVYNMGLGRTVRFLVDLKNVGRFSKIVFTKGDIQDEWQIDAIEIREVSSVGERIMTPLDDVQAGDLILNRIYDRNVEGSVKFFKEKLNILVQPDSEVVFDLEHVDFDIDIEKRDYRKYYYSMDYETAVSDLKFNEAAWNYEVRVHVSPNSILTSANKGDSNGCGSNNIYYFQLVFEEGTSGYVLSNALLKSDCFRAGETESFSVSVNENMGDVVAVKIIPDDVSDECDPLDKLSIDYIEVIKDNPKTPNKRYVCSDVGWINLEYQDNADDVDNPGRLDAQLATVCPVTSSAYMLDLEFNIAIDSYVDRNGVEQEQFYGNLTADIAYTTSSGERKVIRDYPVVEKMYEYAGRSPKTEVYADSSGTERFISDRDFMFRPGSIARFVVPINDAISIESLTLNGMGYKGCSLPIADISIKILKSGGHRIINSNGDYEMIYDIEPALLTDEVPGRSFPQMFHFPANTYTSYPFTFDYNEIEELDESTSLEQIIGRVPKSANDTINLYLYMGKGTPLPEEGGYKLTAKTYYSSVATSNIYMSACDNLQSKWVDGQLVLYATGLSASNMAVVNNIQLVSNIIGREDITVDYGVLQQVRNGVVINTFKIKFGGGMPAMNAKGISMQNKSTSLGYEQIVNVALGEGTVAAKLVEEKYDIALAIRYTSSNASDNTVYISPYVYATDSGTFSIVSGGMLQFKFNEGYVRDIVGIDVLALNGIKATLANANILCYKVDENGSSDLYGWYSINHSGKINKDVTKFSVTDNSKNGINTLKRVNFSFKTAEYAENIDNGGTVPSKMIIDYKDMDGNVQIRTIPDIRDCAGGSRYFAAGQTADISFFLKGVDCINYIKLIPYDDNSAAKASWNLESMSFNIEGGEYSSSHAIPVNRTLVETTDEGVSADDINDIFNLSSIKMTLTAAVGSTPYVADQLDSVIIMTKGEEMTVHAIVSGSATGVCRVQVEKQMGSGYAPLGSSEDLSGRDYSFKPVDAGNYRLTFTVAENTIVSKTINITVNP